MKPYRVLVTGSRLWTDAETIRIVLEAERALALNDNYPMTVVHGDCKSGADAIADLWARRHAEVLAERHPADWRPHGIYNPQAGIARNREMVALGADVCLAFILNGSRGATHCANLAEEAGIPVHRYCD